MKFMKEIVTNFIFLWFFYTVLKYFKGGTIAKRKTSSSNLPQTDKSNRALSSFVVLGYDDRRFLVDITTSSWYYVTGCVTQFVDINNN